MKGGYRPGAGRPKGSTKKKELRPQHEIPASISADVMAENLTPLEYMLHVMNDPTETKDRRDRMAIAAAAFCHARPTNGKKQEQEVRARVAGAGKFSAGRPPLKLIK